MTCMLLRNTSQVSFGTFLSWDWSDVFLMIRLELQVLGRESMRSNAIFCALSQWYTYCQCDSSLLLLTLITWLSVCRLPHCKVNWFFLVHIASLGRKSLNTGSYILHPWGGACYVWEWFEILHGRFMYSLWGRRVFSGHSVALPLVLFQRREDWSRLASRMWSWGMY